MRSRSALQQDRTAAASCALQVPALRCCRERARLRCTCHRERCASRWGVWRLGGGGDVRQLCNSLRHLLPWARALRLRRRRPPGRSSSPTSSPPATRAPHSTVLASFVVPYRRRPSDLPRSILCPLSVGLRRAVTIGFDGFPLNERGVAGVKMKRRQLLLLAFCGLWGRVNSWVPCAAGLRLPCPARGHAAGRACVVRAAVLQEGLVQVQITDSFYRAHSKVIR